MSSSRCSQFYTRACEVPLRIFTNSLPRRAVASTTNLRESTMRTAIHRTRLLAGVAFTSLVLATSADAGGISMGGVSLSIGGGHGVSVGVGSPGIGGGAGVSVGGGAGVSVGGAGVSVGGGHVGGGGVSIGTGGGV